MEWDLTAWSVFVPFQLVTGNITGPVGSSLLEFQQSAICSPYLVQAYNRIGFIQNPVPTLRLNVHIVQQLPLRQAQDLGRYLTANHFLFLQQTATHKTDALTSTLVFSGAANCNVSKGVGNIFVIFGSADVTKQKNMTAGSIFVMASQPAVFESDFCLTGPKVLPEPG